MYYEYFGLKDSPFRNTPDTRVFFTGGKRGAILEALEYAIRQGEGILKVVGEVGSGKTTLCRMLETRLSDNVETVFLANPSLTPENIFHAIAVDLRIPHSATSDKLLVMQLLHEFLLKKHSEGRQVVVLIEEAQGMPLATLEEIRLLSNLETRQSKLLQLVLFGQPELDENLSLPRIRQLRERIAYQFYLSPFSHDEVKEYLAYRLRGAGYRGPLPFSPGAIQKILKLSNGLSRRINMLADKSMLAAFIDKKDSVTTKHVAKAVSESTFAPIRNFKKYVQRLSILILVSVPLAGWFGYQLASNNMELFPVEEVLSEGVDRVIAPAVSVEQEPSATPAIKVSAPKKDSTAKKVVRSAVHQKVVSVATTPIKVPKPVKVSKRVVTPNQNPDIVPDRVLTNAELMEFLKWRFLDTELWLSKSERKRYTIQLTLMPAHKIQRLQVVAQAQGKNGWNFYIKRTIYRGQNHLQIYLNEYDSYSKAVSDISRLPGNLARSGPFVKSIAKIIEAR
jgi:MSHA biogenesis protein MshM